MRKSNIILDSPELSDVVEEDCTPRSVSHESIRLETSRMKHSEGSKTGHHNTEDKTEKLARMQSIVALPTRIPCLMHRLDNDPTLLTAVMPEACSTKGCVVSGNEH